MSTAVAETLSETIERRRAVATGELHRLAVQSVEASTTPDLDRLDSLLRVSGHTHEQFSKMIELLTSRRDAIAQIEDAKRIRREELPTLDLARKQTRADLDALQAKIFELQNQERAAIDAWDDAEAAYLRREREASAQESSAELCLRHTARREIGETVSELRREIDNVRRSQLSPILRERAGINAVAIEAEMRLLKSCIKSRMAAAMNGISQDDAKDRLKTCEAKLKRLDELEKAEQQFYRTIEPIEDQIEQAKQRYRDWAFVDL